MNHTLAAEFLAFFQFGMVNVHWVHAGLSCVHLTFAENWLSMHLALIAQCSYGTPMCNGPKPSIVTSRECKKATLHFLCTVVWLDTHTTSLPEWENENMETYFSQKLYP